MPCYEGNVTKTAHKDIVHVFILKNCCVEVTEYLFFN